MKKLVYLFILGICIWYGAMMTRHVQSGYFEGSGDLATFDRQLALWASGDLTSVNSIRMTHFWNDHQDFLHIVLTPLHWVGLGNSVGLIWITPLLLIFLPLWILDKTFNFSWFILLISGIYLAFAPQTINAILFGYHSAYLVIPLYALMTFLLLKQRDEKSTQS